MNGKIQYYKITKGLIHMVEYSIMKTYGYNDIG